jgi:hypothetical protein
MFHFNDALKIMLNKALGVLSHACDEAAHKSIPASGARFNSEAPIAAHAHGQQ